MSKHVYKHAYTMWGQSFYTCEKCAKQFNEREKDEAVEDCPELTFEQGEYSAGFDFAEKTDAELFRILGGGNIDYEGIKR